MAKIYKKGKLRAEKIQYKDGVGCSIWEIPDADHDEENWLYFCFDFSAGDLDDLIALLQMLKDVEPDKYEDE